MDRETFFRNVQLMMQQHGEALPRYGADGKWGKESDEAFERIKRGTSSDRLDPTYVELIKRIESSGELYAKNPKSSASGWFQFIEKTWKDYGGSWGDNEALAFGGLRPSADEQLARFTKFTQDNEKILKANGIRLNNATRYAAHFLGAGRAVRFLREADSTKMENIATPKEMRANPSILGKGKTVGSFKAWLRSKTGVAP